MHFCQVCSPPELLNASATSPPLSRLKAMARRGAVVWIIALVSEAILIINFINIATTLIKIQAGRDEYYLSGPVIGPDDCFIYGGKEYLKKYQISVLLYERCENRMDKILDLYYYEPNLQVLKICGPYLANLCCFRGFFDVAGPCMGKDQYAFLSNVLDIVNKTMYTECMEPEKISVFAERVTIKCFFHGKNWKELFFNCFYGGSEDVDFNNGFVYYALKFLPQLFTMRHEELCGILTEKLNCALDLLRVCGKVFRYFTELASRVVNTETPCTFDPSPLLNM